MSRPFCFCVMAGLVLLVSLLNSYNYPGFILQIQEGRKLRKFEGRCSESRPAIKKLLRQSRY